MSKDDFSLWMISGDHKESYHVNLRINGKHMQKELDTGAALCVWYQNNSGNNYFQMCHWRVIQEVYYVVIQASSYKYVKGQKEVQVLYERQSLKLPVMVIVGHKRPAFWTWLSEWPQIRLVLATQTTSRPTRTDVSKVQPSFTTENRHHFGIPGRHKVKRKC